MLYLLHISEADIKGETQSKKRTDQRDQVSNLDLLDIISAEGSRPIELSLLCHCIWNQHDHIMCQLVVGAARQTSHQTRPGLEPVSPQMFIGYRGAPSRLS